MKVDQPFLEENQQVITIFISTIAAKIINLSYFCSLYLILLTSGSYLLATLVFGVIYFMIFAFGV